MGRHSLFDFIHAGVDYIPLCSFFHAGSFCVSDFIVSWFLVWHFLYSDLEADLSKYRASDFTSRRDCILRGDYFASPISCQMKYLPPNTDLGCQRTVSLR